MQALVIQAAFYLIIMALNISDIEKDIIREVVSIGLAKAGDSLAAISGEKVLLTVPEINIIEADKMKDFITEDIDADLIIHSDLRGDINGKCLLIFNKEHIEKLADACLTKIGIVTNPEEMKISLILEISNILTGALVTQLANIMELNMHGSAPDYVGGNDFFPLLNQIKKQNTAKPLVFLVTTQFINSGKLLELPLLLLIDMNSLEKMLLITRKKLLPVQNT